MRANRFLQPCVLLLLASSMTAAIGQPRPCSAVPSNEREAARASGACADAAPIDQLPPKKAEPAQVVIPIPNVVGLTFDDARDRLSAFSVRRAYRASAEPGGTVLEQQPASPARVARGAVISVVLSDGTLRPAPRVAASEVDQPPAPATAPAVATRAVVSEPPVAPGNVPQVVIEPSRAAEARPDRAQFGADTVAVPRVPAPQVVGMSIAQAKARLAEFRIERIDRPSNASIGEVIAQSPKALESIARGQPITLIVSTGPGDAAAKSEKLATREVTSAPASSVPPQVSGPMELDSAKAPAESKVERVDVPSAALQSEVPKLDPPAANSVTPDAALTLPASDASLVTPSTTPPVVEPEPAPLTAPVPAPVRAPPDTQVPITFASNAALTLGAGILLGVLIGALLTRRWLLNRRPTIDVIALEPVGVARADTAASSAPVAAHPPGIRFDARLDEGETTIEFTASADVDADREADEMTVEPSDDIHA